MTVRTAGTVVVAAAGVLLGAALLFGGGSGNGRLAWIAGGAVLVAAGAGVAALWGALPAPRLGREGVAFAALASGLVVWIGVTIVWSTAPDRSWAYFNRGLAYLGFAVVGAFVAAVAAPRVAAWLVGGLVAVTSFWALAGKVVPSLYPDYGRLARLRSPVGYWNALALVVAFGLPIALWAASRGGHRRVVRAGAVVVLYELFVALVLTYSRGGVLAALVALGLWFWLAQERFESLVALVEAAVPAGVVVGIALLLRGISHEEPRSVRVHDGVLFGVALVVGGAAAFAAAYFVSYRPGTGRERLLLRAAGVAAVVVVGVGIVAVAASGNPFGGKTQVVQGPSRLGESSLNNRWGWWKEAWHGFVDEPLGGTGAASFEFVHRQYRKSAVDVREVHDLPLQFASETGIVGLALWVGAMAAALLGAWRALGRLGGDERAAVLALGIVVPAFLVHGLLDYDWDFVALSAPLFFVVGFVLAAGRVPIRVAGREYAWMAAVVLVAWAALYSIAAPRVAASRVNAAYDDIERGSIEQARSEAKSAHSLNPLSVDPLEAWASAEEADGNIAKARELYVQAVDLQPLNWSTWYELGRYDREVLGHDAAANRELQRALELDPHGCPARSALNLPCTR